MGSLRDAGATLKYVHRNGLPFSLEAGLFSGSGLTEQKGWHKSLSYSAKLELKPFKGYNLTLSTQRIRPTDKNIYMYDLGTYYDWNNWHFEVETMYKEYPNSLSQLIVQKCMGSKRFFQLRLVYPEEEKSVQKGFSPCSFRLYGQ